MGKMQAQRSGWQLVPEVPASDDLTNSGLVLRPVADGAVDHLGNPNLVVSLDDKAAPISMADDLALRDQQLKEWIAREVIALVKVGLMATLGVVFALVLIDSLGIYLQWFDAPDRLITKDVVLAMIGATMIQIGAALATIAVSTFNRKVDPPKQDAKPTT
jgi:hypothetical protein